MGENKGLVVKKTQVAQPIQNMTLPEVELTIEDIKAYICPKATDKEAMMFLRLCKYQGLNPFVRDAYLIKYSETDPASMVVSKEAFLKRADRLPCYDGFEAGIIVRKGEEIIKKPGSCLVQGEVLIGGWAVVYRTDKTHPFYCEVSLAEYEGKRQDGTLTKFWKKMPSTLIRKDALVPALREAFPNDFYGMFVQEEIMEVSGEDLPTEVIVKDGQVTEVPGKKEKNLAPVLTEGSETGKPVPEAPGDEKKKEAGPQAEPDKKNKVETAPAPVLEKVEAEVVPAPAIPPEAFQEKPETPQAEPVQAPRKEKLIRGIKFLSNGLCKTCKTKGVYTDPDNNCFACGLGSR